MVTVVKHIGNTRITVHSPNGIIAMTPEERQAWFKKAWESGDPVVKGIVEAVCRIHRNRAARAAMETAAVR